MTVRWFGLLALIASSLCGCRLRQGTTGAATDAGMADVELDSPEGQGYLAVGARQCATCHQSANPSDGTLSGQDTPVPGTRTYGSNLTPDPDTGMDVQSAATIASSVLHSIRTDGGTLCSAMPAYADAGMDAAEALSIGAYLRTLEPVRHAVPSSTCAP